MLIFAIAVSVISCKKGNSNGSGSSDAVEEEVVGSFVMKKGLGSQDGLGYVFTAGDDGQFFAQLNKKVDFKESVTVKFKYKPHALNMSQNGYLFIIDSAGKNLHSGVYFGADTGVIIMKDPTGKRTEKKFKRDKLNTYAIEIKADIKQKKAKITVNGEKIEISLPADYKNTKQIAFWGNKSSSEFTEPEISGK